MSHLGRDLFVAKDNQVRMYAILEDLKKPTRNGAIRQHDLLAFQEMFSRDTYKLFRVELKTIYPYSHYYESGPVGSGLAIFSAHPITKVSFMAYTLNGHPGKIFDGDWFANKGVAHARLTVDEHTVDVFTTHLIASYTVSSDDMDRYQAHRITQMYELMNFVQGNIPAQSAKNLGTIILGDLNIEMSSLEWRAILHNQHFVRSIFEGRHPSLIPCTCNCPLNTYKKQSNTPKTIDHILFTPQQLKLLSFSSAFIGDAGLYDMLSLSRSRSRSRSRRSYSDHLAVTALFKFYSDKEYDIDKGADWNSLSLAIKGLGNELDLVKHQRKISIFLVVALVMLLVLMILLFPSAYISRRYVRVPPSVIISIIAAIPVVTTLLLFHLVLCFWVYPIELARLGQFVVELQYQLSATQYQ